MTPEEEEELDKALARDLERDRRRACELRRELQRLPWSARSKSFQGQLKHRQLNKEKGAMPQESQRPSRGEWARAIGALIVILIASTSTDTVTSLIIRRWFRSEIDPGTVDLISRFTTFTIFCILLACVVRNWPRFRK